MKLQLSRRIMLSLGMSLIVVSGASAATDQTPTKHKRKVAATSTTTAEAKATSASVPAAAPIKAKSYKPLITASASDLSAPETLVVTGSALSHKRDQDANPVQIISSKEIQQTSAVTLGDYLARIPSIGSNGTSNTQTNGGVGLSCTDIRGLGQSRVLVLVDGKRQVQTMGSASSCVNLNSIPLDQVDSVEILKDGGSELYGADAVSGVINIKLKHNLTTGGFDIKGGISDKGDGQMGKISGYKGFNFDHGRGNITIFGQYMTQSGIQQKNRSWSSHPWNSDTTIGESPTIGSSVTANTRVIDPNGNFDLVSDNAGGTHSFSDSDRYNFGTDQDLTNNLQESNLSGDAHYDVDEHFQLYANVHYTHQTAMNSLAGDPVTGATYPSTLESSVVLPAGNPYNTYGEDVDLYKRFSDVGDRKYEEAFDTWQVMGGSKGKIFGKWFYDASMTYGQSLATYSTENMINYKKYLEELGSEQTDPTDSNSAVVYNPSICTSQPGCTLINPFTKMSSQALDYIRYTQNDHSTYQMRDFNFRVNNNDLVKLPYEHGGNFGLAFGIEHRSEQASYTPDEEAVNGDLGGGSTYTGGGYNVTEAYIEGKLPLLQNAFLAKDLTIDGQGRWSHYSNFGDAYNWKGSINWAPVKDIRFRATLGTSFRAPALSELYGGHSISYESGEDPCAQASSYGKYTAKVIATCAKQGINTSSFVDANSSQIPTLTGGNSALKPEEGRTYTVGAVVTPRWIPGLMISAEYWHYTLKNMITTVPVQYIVDQCYTGQNTSYCDKISSRSTAGQLTQVNDTYENVGGLRTSGLDLDLEYNLRLSYSDMLSFSNNIQYLLNYKEQNEAGGQWYNYTGRLLYQSGYGMPRIRDYATATWRHNNFTFTYMMSYTDAMKYNDGSEDLSCSTYSYCKVPGIFAHDVTVSYQLKQWNFKLGVNNIFDKQAPFVADGATNTALAMYAEEIIGRYVFADIGARF